LSGSTWSGSSELSADTDWIEDGKADVAVTADDKVHVVYKYDALDSYYREWDGSMSNYFDFTPSSSDGGYAQRISSNGNDIYALWISEDGASGYELKLRQRDYAPLKPVGVDVESSTNNHPLISWDASEAADLQHYKVYKRDPDSYPNFSYLATTTSTSYEDTEEEVAGEPAANQYDVDYRVTAVDYQDNESSQSSTVSIKVQGEPLSSWGESIALQNISINDFALAANHPNPFNPTTHISYALPEASIVTLEVFDVSGRKVSVLVKKSQEQGWHYATFDGGTLPSGIYIYRINATGMESGKRFTQAKRMLLVK